MEEYFLEATRNMVTWEHCVVLIKDGKEIYKEDLTIEEAIRLLKEEDYIAVPF